MKPNNPTINSIPMQSLSPCPCGTTKDYAHCCGVLHSEAGQATTAEQLMRSRYSAFVLMKTAYLWETLHPTKRDAMGQVAWEQTIVPQPWLRLQVIGSEQGSPTDDVGEVEFVAFYESQPLGQLHERSRFVKEAGRWTYLDGTLLPALQYGRNDRCGCGSGKKFKKCHG